MQLYDTFSKALVPFEPLKAGEVRMYNCGPTVYDYAHIGNFRSYVFADLLRRYLEYRGLTVWQVMNITDVGHMVADADVGEDKVETAAKQQKKTPWEVAAFYTQAFLEDAKALNLKEPMKRPKATEHVAEMVGLIKTLVEKGLAYESSGSVYFDVRKFKRYGKLSGNSLRQLKAGARKEPAEGKRYPLDFALWIRKEGHVMQWDSPWGKGYPGWHIECSAMAMRYLGESMDIHTGGEDNMFPHHECEIAQSEGATGRRFARCWLHVRHLLVGGEKMSKSLGNFHTIRDLLAKGADPMAIRYLLLSAHYRATLNFTEDGLRAAAESVKRLREFAGELSAAKGAGGDAAAACAELRQRFEAALDDDLNVPEALSAVFAFVASVRAQPPGALGARKAFEALMDIDSVLGLGLREAGLVGSEEAEVAGRKLQLLWHIQPRDDLRKLVLERERARAEKRWADADAVRAKLKEHGVLLEDREGGVAVKKA